MLYIDIEARIVKLILVLSAWNVNSGVRALWSKKALYREIVYKLSWNSRSLSYIKTVGFANMIIHDKTPLHLD